jgi:hypothetical protein
MFLKEREKMTTNHTSEIKKPLILLKKTYSGFESFYDYFRDTAEVCEFPEDKNFLKVKGEFKGEVRVLVEFIPSEGDLLSL